MKHTVKVLYAATIAVCTAWLTLTLIRVRAHAGVRITHCRYIVGDRHDGWQYVAAGDPFTALDTALSDGSAGQMVVSQLCIC
jgi:hypothetical protein